MTEKADNRISYAAVLKRAIDDAKRRQNDGAFMRDYTWETEADTDAAALRELARLCEQIQQMQRRIDEWRETATTGTMQMREPLTLLELIARGFHAETAS